MTKAMVEQLQVLASAALPGSPEQKDLLDRIERSIKMAATLNAEWVAGLEKVAPHHDWRGAVLLQIVLSGSATGGKEAVNPENAKAAATGLPALTEAAAKVKAAAGPPEPGMAP